MHLTWQLQYSTCFAWCTNASWSK